MPALNPFIVALILSIAANGVLGWAYLGQRDATTTAAHQRDDARSDASACSDATEDLRTLADKRGTAAAQARAAAATAAKSLSQRADYTLSLPPKVPGDACASMQALGDEWLQGRAEK